MAVDDGKGEDRITIIDRRAGIDVVLEHHAVASDGLRQRTLIT